MSEQIREMRASIVLLFAAIFSLIVTIETIAEEAMPLSGKRFSWNASSSDLHRLMESVFQNLQSSGLLSGGYPQYARTEIVGRFDKPHFIKAVPLVSMVNADAILVNENEFITFEVWGLNARASFFTDFVFLLKDKDPHAMDNHERGVRQFKYVEVDYANILPVTQSGMFGGDFSQANKIMLSVRQGLRKAGADQLQD